MDSNLNRYFIELEKDFDKNEKQPASYVRMVFNLCGDLEQARLEITALGVYKAWLNGEPLDDQLLLPGYTDYNYRLQVQSYDVKNRLKVGENVLAAVVGDGWYRGSIGIGSHRNRYGSRLKFMAAVTVLEVDGTKKTFVSDDYCRVTQNGPLRSTDIKTLEQVDRRMDMDGWTMSGFDDAGWNRAKRSFYEGALIAHEGEPVLEHEVFMPEVLTTPNGQNVLDFGQNMAGHVAFTVSGRAGQTVLLTMGEVLDECGNFTQKNLSAQGSAFISGALGQKLSYTLKDGTQTYKSMFLISGFRYVLLENWPEKVLGENFKAIAVYSDLKETGTFECSNPLVNRLVHNVNWSRKSNFVDIPTDCPTRERSGWTGDIAVFAETASYMTDTRRFLHKWLQDFKLEQMSDGNLPYVVPSAGMRKLANGCMGWSTAIAHVPYILYRFYGDKSILEDVYETVKAFIDFNVKRARKRNPLLFLKRYGKQRKYIIETGFHYGEWLEPGTAMYKDFIKDLFYPDTEVNTAWFYQMTREFVFMAKTLGREADAKIYGALAKNIKAAYRRVFFKKGKIHSKRQCRYVRPIAMELLSDTETEQAGRALNEQCICNDYKIGTGFLTTYKILSVLTQCGFVDTAYKILENTKQPGWLYAVTKGSTTTWENWNGIDAGGVPVDSHNHYAPGAVVAWLYSDCAGIRPLKPGFEKVLIKPVPGGSFTYAKAVYESCHGRIVSDWRIEDGKFYLKVEVPETAPARVMLPDGSAFDDVVGAREFWCEYR